MRPVNQLSAANAASETITTQNLLNLYETTRAELKTCAEIKPAANCGGQSAEVKEEVLSVFETNLLDVAAGINLNASEDFQNLINMWEKVSQVEDTENIRPADRIARNIFRHLMNAEATNLKSNIG